MSNNSPYGEVSQVRLIGAISHRHHSIKFRVVLFINQNTEQFDLSAVAYRAELEWNGVGVREYPYQLARGQEARVHVAFAHSEALSTLRLTTSIYFYGRGHIFFPQLDVDTRKDQRNDFVQSYHIPLDIERQEMGFGTEGTNHLRNNKPRFVNLEALYGMPVRNGEKSTTTTTTLQNKPAPPLVDQRKEKKHKKNDDDPMVVGLPDLREDLSFVEAKEHAARIERQHVEHVLEPVWWEFITAGLRMIFAHKMRVRHFACYWLQSLDASKYDNASQKYAAFIESVLSARCQLVVTESFVSFFAPHQLFMVPRTHLTQDELVFVNQLVVHRKQLFRSEYVQFSHYKLEDFRLNHLLQQNISPRFIIQQFCLDCFDEMHRTQDASVVSVLLGALAQCVRTRPNDMFLSYLRYAFDRQQHVVQDIEHAGAFVQMTPGAAPEYERVSAAKRKTIAGHPTTPLVPLSLMTTTTTEEK